MCIETAATGARVTLKGLSDVGYMGFNHRVGMFESGESSFQRKEKGGRQIS